MKPMTTSSERDDLGLLVAELRGSVVDIHEVYQPYHSTSSVLQNKPYARMSIAR
jgi:hypothetical protein